MCTTTALTAGWQLTDTAPGAGDAAVFSAGDLNTDAWLPAPVPGDINAVLVAAGRMPNPHFGDQARQCYWVTSRDWWYRLVFTPPADGAVRTELCLDGVDGTADLYLNGALLARFANAFRPYRIDVAGTLLPGQANVLLLRFHAIDACLGGPREDPLKGWGERRTRLRKPQFCFGWDWSLPLPSLGLSDAVRLEQHDGPRLLDATVRTFVSGRLDWSFAVNTAARAAGYRLRLHIRGPGFTHEEVIERPGRVHSYITVPVPEPRLWWPHGSGAQELYAYTVSLETAAGEADRRAGRFGIREIGLLEEPFTREAGPGRSFWLTVNGTRVFCKGGNWIPLEIWPATATDEQCRFYLARAADAGFNMLRVWGGGIYERPAFYEACDERGLLVWQDFMFASAGYPLEALRDEIAAEAEHQIKRLRNHACVALWCGCNEDVFSWKLPNEQAMVSADTGAYSDASTDTAARRLRDDPQLYTMMLRGLVSRHGHGVPYVESSPQSHDDAGNMPESGNCHISCWKHGLYESYVKPPQAGASILENYREGRLQPERFRGHFEKVCSFNSEFCIQGPCDAHTLRRFLPPGHQWPPDALWTYHIQRGHSDYPHHEQTIMFGEALFGPVESLDDYVKHGQAVHAEMMRAEFESARRDRPNNGGTMMWMFNDCWPTSNWSIIDYDRRPKPSYYAARRACAMWLPIIFERAGRIEFFLSNDGCAPGAGVLRYGQAHLAGTVVWERRQDVQVGGCDTARVDALDLCDLAREAGDYLFIDACVQGAALPRVTYFPDLWRAVPWPAPRVCVRPLGTAADRNGDWLTRLEVTTDAYARFCHLQVPDDARPFWIDDNFYDLTVGDRRLITIHSAQPLDASRIASGHWLTTWP